MLGKRQTRGNVAIAALLFVTAIGVGAVALDSARVAQSPRSQLAATPVTQKTTEPAQAAKNVKGKCEIGFDYEIRETKGVPEIKKRGPTQCVKTNDTTTVYKDQEGKDRYCSKEGWRCRYYYCKIDELRVKNSKGITSDAECVLIPTAGKPGEEADLTSERTVALKDALQKKFDSGTLTKEEAAVLAPLAQSMDKTVQASLLSAFDTNVQKQKLDEFQKSYNKANDELAACLAFGLPDVCVDKATAADEAKQKVDAQTIKLQNLAKNAQELDAVKKVLKSETPIIPPDNCPAGTTCTKGPSEQPGGTRTDTFDRSSGPSAPPSASSGSGFNAGDLLKTLGQALPLINSLSNLFGGSGNAPTCTLRVSPTNITSPGQSVTLSWTTTNAQSAYLSNVGQVGPSGSMTVNPQQATTFSMQVTGYPQQQQQQQQPQGQFVYNPYTSQYQYVQGQQQPNTAQGSAQQGQCQVQLTMGQGTGTDASAKPKAQISCQPKIADVGMQVSISYACQNSNTSSGEGFSTNSQLSGSATTTVASPSLGSTTVTYGVTCSKDGVTDSAQCTTNVNKPSIVLVANPRDIEEGERTTIGWVTGAMDKCVISSPTLSDFTEDNKGNTSVSGSVRTPELTRDTNFVLTCTTKAGTTKTAETTVRVDD